MFTIRLASVADQAAIEALIAESSRGLGAPDYSSAQIEGALQAAWGLDTQLIEDQTYYAVEAGEDLAGCGGWSYRATLFGNDAEQDRDANIIDPQTGAAKIRAFFVKPDYARQGIGSLIMRTCEAQARSRGYGKLELMATLPGQRLYLAHGFTPGAPIDYPLGGTLTIPFVPMSKTLNSKQ